MCSTQLPSLWPAVGMELLPQAGAQLQDSPAPLLPCVLAAPGVSPGHPALQDGAVPGCRALTDFSSDSMGPVTQPD